MKSTRLLFVLLAGLCLVASLPAAPMAELVDFQDAATEAAGEELSFGKKIEQTADEWAGKIVKPLMDFLFYPLVEFEGKDKRGNVVAIPVIIAWLVIGAVFFTLRMGFINLRGFKHAIAVVRGKYSSPDDEGEVTHFQALASALSATVGLGNIAGVAIAVGLGGPGAVFWMVVAGFLGMSSKFAECSLGQMYRKVRPDGKIMGGAMYYLSDGLKEMGLGPLGKVLAAVFAIFCIGGAIGGGNTFQVNQSLGVVSNTVPFFAENSWVYGLIMMVLVGIVIVGGIKRIAATAEKIVPAMCLIYVLACLFVLVKMYDQVPAAFGAIFNGAFNSDAVYGGFIGVLIRGFRRAAFSNEAGVGSAAIAHSAAKSEYPVREGIVALLEPFIDTIVVCTMTGLVIVITGAYNNPEYAQLVIDDQGAAVTAKAFEGVISWFPYILAVATALFAYSTIISWSYYGERCFTYLVGDKGSMVFRIGFLPFVFAGSVISAPNVKDFSDMMIFAMAFPNILGVALLSGKVRRQLDDYWKLLKSGQMKVYK